MLKACSSGFEIFGELQCAKLQLVDKLVTGQEALNVDLNLGKR